MFTCFTKESYSFPLKFSSSFLSIGTFVSSHTKGWGSTLNFGKYNLPMYGKLLCTK